MYSSVEFIVKLDLEDLESSMPNIKESSKIVWKYFWILPPSNYDTSAFCESTDTKIFKKFEQKLAFEGSQSISVEQNAFLTTKKTKTGTSVKLKWKFMTLAIFCGVGLVQASTLAEKNTKNIENSGTI